MRRSPLILLLAIVILAFQPATVLTQVAGEWSAVMLWPYRAIHAALLPTSKVLFWDSYDRADNPQFWDWATNTISAATKAGYNIFCVGFGGMADGKLFMAGGHIADNVGLDYAYTYDPALNSWTPLPNMNAGRWYPTVTNLPNGDVLVLGGVQDTTVGMNILPQVWQTQTGTWRDLTSAQLWLPFYPFTFVAPNGRVFAAGPTKTTRYLDTSGSGAWSVVGDSQFGATGTWYGSRQWGSAVMYEPGKVLLVGGAQCPAYQNTCTSITATAEVIDLNSATPSWRYVGSMANPRKQLNLTLLPDGRVLATGGSSGALGYDDSTSPVYAAEVWDPAAETWTTWASSAVYRGYHSTSLLLPDGRVLHAGGNKSGTELAVRNAEVFSPPYLFNGSRPTITAAPDTIGYGDTFRIDTSDAISQVTLIRLGDVTHSFNMSQRFNRLSFSPVSGAVNVTAPATGNLAPLGYYMLFILNTSGVPSVAKIVRLAPSNAPTNLAASAVSSSQIDLAWLDNATNESGFRIERCSGTNCTSFVEIATVGANATSYQNTGLLSSTSYSYRVRAVKQSGTSAYSNTASATTQAGQTAPAAPTNLATVVVSSSQINLTWTDNATNESGFRIERCTGTGCTSFAEITTVGVNATSYQNTGLLPATSYSYRVRAFNQAGTSAYSNTASATTQSVAPSAPSNLRTIVASTSQINLAWTDTSTNESGFRIERCNGTGCTSFVQIATVGPNTTGYQNSGLTAGQSYRYRARAYNSGGNSGYSNTATTTIAAPSAPGGLTAQPQGSNLQLAWTDSSNNETGFRIERCTGSGCTNFVTVATTGANLHNYKDSAVTSLTTYRYRVFAYNGVGNSGYSNTVSATTR
jgi:hypothetical protein